MATMYGRIAYIWDLFVAEEHRRQCVAKELMQYALKRAKDFGFETAMLEWCLQDTPYEIREWYLRLGFKNKKFFNDNFILME